MTTSERSDIIRLSSASLEVELNLDLGAEIRSISRPGGPNVLARFDGSAPLSMQRSGEYGDQELDWLSDYRGGWQELFPNAGDACVVDGVPLPMHGEVSRARWEATELADDHVTLRCAARLPLVLERRMRLSEDPPALLLEEVVRSDAPVPSAFLMGHHPAFVAAEGARIDMPHGTALLVDEGFVTDLGDLAAGSAGTWPNASARNGGTVRIDSIGAAPVERLVYLSEMGATPWAAVRHVQPGLGVALAWDGTTYPCAWNWWEVGGPDFPWYGRARIVAIEPNTSFPSDGLAAARSRGEAHELLAGGEHHTWLTLSLFDADERPVTGVGRDGSVAR